MKPRQGIYGSPPGLTAPGRTGFPEPTACSRIARSGQSRIVAVLASLLARCMIQEVFGMPSPARLRSFFRAVPWPSLGTLVAYVSILLTVLFAAQSIRKQNHEMAFQSEQGRAQWATEVARLQRDSEHEKRLANDQFLERARTELRTETLKAEQASFPGVD